MSMRLLWTCLVTLLASLLAGCVEPGTEAFEVRTAQFTALEGSADVGRTQVVSLPDGWDFQQPPRHGAGEYRFKVPRTAFTGSLPMLYLPKAGNEIEVFVGDLRVYQNGGGARIEIPGDSVRRSRPHLVPLGDMAQWPPGNEVPIRVRITGKRLNIAGLSHVYAGDRSVLYSPFRVKEIFHVEATWMVSAVCLGMSLLTFLLWTRVREPEYLLFAGAAMVWSWRTASPGQMHLLLPPVVWSYVFLASFGWFVALIALYVVQLVPLQWRGWRRLWWGFFWLNTVWYAAVVVFGWFFLRTPMNTLTLVLVGALCVALWRATWREPRPDRLALSLAGVICWLAGLRDWWAINFDPDRYANQTWVRYATLSFLGVMAWLVVDRFVSMWRRTLRVNEELEAKVKQREAELAAVFERQREETRRQAVSHERERIVREMHDGIGGQLMTALRGVERGAFSQERLAELLQESLDDLRLIIDATSADTRLLPALAAWRNRWDPRLEALGLELSWQVEEAVGQVDLAPDVVLQLMRILQEAVTNAVKHAQGSVVGVRVEVDAGTLRLEVMDNGRGWPDGPTAAGQPTPGRHGLRSMRTRAVAIGAGIDWLPDVGSGIRVRLLLPLGGTPSAAVGSA